MSTQQSLPWTGISTDEARSVDTGAIGAASVRSHALSGDGRFVAFTANYPLISSDTNDTADIYVRDRVTGSLELISIGADGSPANDQSDPAAISEDGRHVAFLSSASNLVSDDNNGVQDVFVYDRVTHVTSLVSIGVMGDQADFGLYDGISLSADGRFVTFMAIFGGPLSNPNLYLRDRDPDMNGVFDEPDLATTIEVVPTEVGDWTIYYATEGAISPDGRYVAFAATADRFGIYGTNGIRLFLLDRETSATTWVDVPLGGEDVFQAEAHGLSLSNGYLAYVSNIDGLVEDDGNGGEDVFVYDIGAATNSMVRAEVPNPPEMSFRNSTGISADGRYVIFGGHRYLEPFGIAAYGFAVDRETSQTHEIGLRPDGSRTESVFSMALSADGSAIAFWGVSDVLVHPDFNNGIYVETAISMSPETLDIPQDGGTFTIELNAPAASWWSVDHPDYVTVTPASGVGAATLTVTVDANVTGFTRETIISVGSESSTLRQVQHMIITGVQPPSGTINGSDVVTIVGSGFTPETTVTFGGVPAEWVVWLGSEGLQVSTPPHPVGFVDVVVSDAASSATLPNGFRYLDDTPPQITMTVSGAQGANDWYVGPVTVVWSVEDPESGVTIIGGCGTVVYSTDTTGELASCIAASEGGTESSSFEVRIDSTAPAINIVAPQEKSYALNQQITLAYNCDDITSGLNFCIANQAGPRLNTSTVGSFTFSVNAEDAAGNVALKNVNYAVKLPTFLAVPPTSATYGGSASLRTTLTGNGSPLANRTVLFLIDNIQVGSAVTNASGLATLTVNIAGTTAGNHPVRTQFAEDQTALSATGNGTLIVNKAPTTVTWNAPSPITYGTPLSDTQLNATANVPGTFVYTPAAAAVLNAGTHTLSVTFTPSDSTNYLSSSGSVSIVVNKATPSITWSSPAPITYGTALNVTQLNATANVAGLFNYMPAAGTVLAAGPQNLSVLFTPADGANYNNATANRALTVTPAPLTIQANNVSKVYGQSLPAFTVFTSDFVNGDTIASLSGTLSFSTSATVTSAPGSYPVTPAGLSSTNYAITFTAGILTIGKADTVVTLSADPNPSRPNRDVALQAVVSAVAPGAGTATGSVEFRDNGTLLGTATLVNGVATFTRGFKKGAHPLTATFVGDANFSGSVGSATLTTN